MPEDKRPRSGNSALHPALQDPVHLPGSGEPRLFQGERRAEIPPSTSAPHCRALLTPCYAAQPWSETPRNLAGVCLAALLGGRIPFTSGAGQVCCVFLLSRQHNRARHSQNDLGDAIHEYTCSICQGTRSALVSAAAAGPHHGTARQFSVPEGGEGIK